MRDLGNYGEVWYHPNGIANILSLASVRNMFRVTFDSKNENEFTLWKDDGCNKIFKQSAIGLYYLDKQGEDQKQNKNKNEGLQF